MREMVADISEGEAPAAVPPVHEQNVRVAVRVRPMVAKEKLEKQASCLRVLEADQQIIIGKDRAFSFDFVFGEESTQQRVYEDACAPLLAGCMQGFNATIFAYGQTGSGKTFTMGSGGTEGADTAADADARGVIPRVVDGLFDNLEALAETTDTTVRVSYLEIYNEEVKDLLHPRTPSKSISIREDAAGGIFVMGVQERVVQSRDELFAALEAGCLARATGSTLMNAVSSRSHSLFSVIVEQRPRAPGSERTCAKLHLVDLAGSERAKKTGAVGARFKESVTINQGLLALGNVIAALCDDTKLHKRKDSQHVPYRESKLTRLLQDSLGGNTQTLMVACIGPADGNLDESLNTLRYANRARQIHNKPIANIEAPSVVDLQGEIAALQLQLQQQQQSAVRFGSAVRSPSASPSRGGGGADGSAGGGRRLASGSSLMTLDESSAVGQAAPVPLSRSVLDALRVELAPGQLQRVLAALAAGERRAERLARTPDGSPIASPAGSAAASPSMGGGAGPNGGGVMGEASASMHQLRHTLLQWGRSEAHRAQLLQRLDETGGGALLPPAAGGELESHSSLDAAGAPASSHVGALRSAAERAQLLQALGMQQFGALEGQVLAMLREHNENDADAANANPGQARGGGGGGEVQRLRAALEAKDAELRKTNAELSEAKDDLTRDETIFADKMQELSRLTKAHQALLKEHEELKAERQQQQRRPSQPPDAAAAAADRSPAKAAPPRARTPPSAASTRSLPSQPPSRSSPRSKHGHSPMASGLLLSEARSEASSLRSDRARAAETSTQLAFSPTRAFAEQLEANDDVLCDDGAPPAEAGADVGTHADQADDAPVSASASVQQSPIGSAAGSPDGLAEASPSALQQSIRELEDERLALQSTTAVVSAAAAESDALQEDFAQQQERLGSSVQDLALNIRLKEELIRDLTKADEQSRSAVSAYQTQLKQMSDRVAALQGQLQQLQSEMETAERQAGKSEEQKSRLRTDYEKRLRETEGQLSEMKRKQREQERALRSREAAERKLGELRGEVDKMRGQQSSLKDAMKASQQRYEQARLERERELAYLRKKSEESAKKVRALEQLNARQQVQLQRQSEINSKRRSQSQQHQAQQRHARGGGGSAVASASGTRGGARANAPSAGAPHAGAQEEAEAREAAAELAAIAREEEALMRRKEAAAALELELKRREAVLSEREAVLADREGLQLRQLRTSLSLRNSMDGLSAHLAQVEAKIEARKGGGNGGGEPGGGGSGDELPRLLAERREAQERIDELAQANGGGSGSGFAGTELLDAAASSELRELDERLEDLTAQLEFKNSAIGELRESLGRLGGKLGGGAPQADDAALGAQIEHMSLPIARRVLRAKLHRVLEMRHEQAQAARRLETAELAQREREEEVASLRHALRTASQEHERQLREVQHQHEAQHEALVQQQSALAAQVTQLTKQQQSALQAHQAGTSPPPSSPTKSVAPVGTPPSSGARESRDGSVVDQRVLDGANTPSREALEALGKDNFYYKQTNRELRRKLRDAAGGAETQRQQLEEALQRIAYDEQVNAKLQAELANMRAYLQAHPGATPTRVTKAALKEITPDVASGGAPRLAWGGVDDSQNADAQTHRTPRDVM